LLKKRGKKERPAFCSLALQIVSVGRGGGGTPRKEEKREKEEGKIAKSFSTSPAKGRKKEGGRAFRPSSLPT